VALSSSQRSALGITHVLSVCPDYPAEPEDSRHLCIPVQDSEFENLLVHLPIACRFIQDAIDVGGKVLVHCVMGVSRSATVICAYRKSPRPSSHSFVSVPLPPPVMKTRKVPVAKAIGYLRDSELACALIFFRPYSEPPIAEQGDRRSTLITGS
jgi:hypothetical protein